MDEIFKLEKEILDCVRSSLSGTCPVSKSDIEGNSVFDKLLIVFRNYFERPSTNMLELRKKTKRQKGLIFEIFCKMYLKARGYDDVWLLNEIPQEIKEYLQLPNNDMGIDLVARIKIPNRKNLKVGEPG